MFIAIKPKNILTIIIVFVLTSLLSLEFFKSIKANSQPKFHYTIVVDAGHGGRDDGCTGVNGTKESVINLSIAKTLKEYIESLGIRVVMTRSDGNGLYSANADNYKQSDMEKRIGIINKANPDMVISIHQNSFNDSSQKGAQVFYQEDDDVSREFAVSVQSQLLSQLEFARKESNFGDYYLLKECDYPSILVECGYLTNLEEEELLNTNDYQNKVAYAIMCGVVKYFNLCGND
jgi:N-acetylmuramoyl-L-alanine amidase